MRAADDYRLELVEEPLRDPKPEDLRYLRREFKCPVVLDESVVTPDDIDKFEGCIGGINIKVQKVGGLRNSMRMIERARAMGMRVMVGCMLETSIGISASAALAGIVDYIDLDSIVLIDDDPYAGVTHEDGRLVIPQGVGHAAVEAG